MVDSAIGSGTFSPSIVVPVLRSETSTSTRWRSLIFSMSARLARSVSCPYEPDLEIVEKGARDPAARHLPEVVDTGH